MLQREEYERERGRRKKKKSLNENKRKERREKKRKRRKRRWGSSWFPYSISSSRCIVLFCQWVLQVTVRFFEALRVLDVSHEGFHPFFVT